jgi:hypothetical protein
MGGNQHIAVVVVANVFGAKASTNCLFSVDNFYTIKSLCEGDFGVKIFFLIFGGSFRGAKFLTRMLSLFLRRFFVVWAKQTFLWSF